MANKDGQLLYNFTQDLRTNNRPRFRWLLQHDRFGIEGLCNLIHYVCEIGDVEFLKDLYDTGSDITTKNPDNKTPLYTACEFGQTATVTELLRLMYLNIAKKNDTTITTIEGIGKSKPADNKANKSSQKDLSKPFNKDSLKPSDKDARSPLVSAETLDDAGSMVEIAPKKPPKRLCERICGCCCDGEEEEDLLGDSPRYDTSHPLYAKDTEGRNCFYIAALNEHKEVVDVLLNLEFRKLQPLLESSCPVTDEKSGIIYHDSPLRMLIRNMPDLAQRVLDKYIDRSQESDSIWMCHYNLLDDNYLHQCGPDKCHCQKYVQARKLAKDNHPLMLAYKNRAILGHHLVTSLLYHKWRRLRPIHFAMLAWYALFMTFITAYMLATREFQHIHTVGQNETHHNHDTRTQRHLGLMLCGMSIVGVAIEVIQVILMRRLYMENSSHFFQNSLDWLMYIFAVWVVMFPLEGTRTNTQWEIGSACLLASWFNFLLHHPGFSNYLHMIAEVFAELWRFTLVFGLVLLMFGFTFAVLLNNQLAFMNIFGAVIRTWTMMLGDISYGELFHSEEDDGETHYKTMTYIVFIIFILLGLIITNMWTGFIINRLSDVEKTAITRKLHTQLDYILTVEYFLPSCMKRWFVYSRHKQQVQLGVKHRPLMLMVSMLLGDMKFSMPTVDALKKATVVKQSKSDQAEEMIKNFKAMMEKLNNEEEVVDDVATSSEVGTPTTPALLE